MARGGGGERDRERVASSICFTWQWKHRTHCGCRLCVIIQLGMCESQPTTTTRATTKTGAACSKQETSAANELNRKYSFPAAEKRKKEIQNTLASCMQQPCFSCFPATLCATTGTATQQQQLRRQRRRRRNHNQNNTARPRLGLGLWLWLWLLRGPTWALRRAWNNLCAMYFVHKNSSSSKGSSRARAETPAPQRRGNGHGQYVGEGRLCMHVFLCLCVCVEYVCSLPRKYFNTQHTNRQTGALWNSTQLDSARLNWTERGLRHLLRRGVVWQLRKGFKTNDGVFLFVI